MKTLEDYKEELEKIVKWWDNKRPEKEEEFREMNKTSGAFPNPEESAKRFEWDEVGVAPGKLNKLVELGALEIIYKSGKRTMFKPDIDMIRNFLYAEEITELSPEDKSISSEDLFGKIVGYDDLKDMLKLVIQNEKPIGCILWGPPASGKSLLLEDIYHYYSNAEFMTGYEFSKAGLSKLTQRGTPDAIIIDEIDKSAKEAMSPLLQVMEGGYIRRVKGDQITDAQRKEIKVFMAGNRIKNIPDEVISRCKPFVLYLPEYSYEQFKQICLNYLPLEDVSDEVATYIAEKVWEFDRDVRAARNLARVCGDSKEMVEKMLSVVKTYKNS